MKVQLVKVPLSTYQETAPPLVGEVLLTKVQSVKVPLNPFQLTAPPPTPVKLTPSIYAELLIKIQLLKAPLAPAQKTAPPTPLEKLKFHENKKIQLKLKFHKINSFIKRGYFKNS